MSYYDYERGRSAEIAELRGATLISAEGCSAGSGEMTLTTEGGQRFIFWHEDDCCERVEIHQVDGDPGDLLRSPLLMAEEEVSEAKEGEVSESGTWTFYKFATVKGYVTVRWLGQSNGYYSERVSLRLEEPANDNAMREAGVS